MKRSVFGTPRPANFDEIVEVFNETGISASARRLYEVGN